MRTYSLIAGLLAVVLFSGLSLASGPDGRLSPTAVGLKNFSFDTKQNESSVPPGLEGRPPSPGKPGFIIIKFKDKINAADRERLKKDGVRFYGYVPVNAFLAKVPYAMRDAVASDPEVESVVDYRPAYRLDKEPLGWVIKKARGKRRLILQAFDGEDLSPIEAAIQSMGGTYEVRSDRPGLNGKLLRIEIDIKELADIAALDGVLWIEEYRQPVLYNDVSCGIIKADYAWGQGVPLAGTGQVVAVCDTGLDTGNLSTMHADFVGNTSDGYPKLKLAFAYTRPGDWSDRGGHGTHTCGTAVGFGVKSNSLVPGTFIRGIAYDAQLVLQSAGDKYGHQILSEMPDLGSVLFPDAYNAGARIHSDSWGSPFNSAGSYDATYSQEADTYAWDHKDFVIVFAAGNNGTDADSNGVVDQGSVVSTATAKNVISVGASENNRPSIFATYSAFSKNLSGTFKTQPIKSDLMADNPGGMTAFSARGPCLDGRIKPDIVAPGTYVLSAKSSVGNIVWDDPSNHGYSNLLDPYYTFLSGTSMADPAVAGAAAIVREFLAGKGYQDPSSALIKGLLINGAYDMTPGQYASPKQDVTARPDMSRMSQGWGRVDLKEALFPDDPKTLLFDDHTSGLEADGSFSYSFTVQDSSVPVRVSLVWTDHPGTPSVSPNLVNDLDLVVTAPDGRVYHGNQYSGSVSVPGASSFDRINNVEGVTIPARGMTTGTMAVQVQAQNVPFGPQPYALVVSGGFSGPVVTDISPTSGVNNAATAVTVTGQGFAAGARVFVGGMECQVESADASSIGATVPAGISAGAKDVVVRNPDLPSGVLTGGFLVTQDNTVPAAPRGLMASPGNASVNLKWTPNTEPDLAGYRVYFGGYSTTAGLANAAKLAPLTNGRNYDIYIRAFDAAGNFSPPSSTVSATPLAPNPDLPHYNWDGSPAFACGSCHVTGGNFLQGFDYRTDPALCLSCHNSTSVAHDKRISLTGSHKMFVAAGSGNTKRPAFGTVTSGEYSDTMYTHLKSGSLVVCATCHNGMRKPYDVGRAWEYTSTPGGRTYNAFRGGWWDQPHLTPSVYYDTSLWTPSYSRDREARKVDTGAFSFNEYSGSVSFTGVTTVSPTGYVCLTLDDPYLRAPGADNTVCLDCHVEATHQSESCLACHGAHGITNIKGMKSSVRKPDGIYRDVVFKRFTGVDSFAGERARTGICEVCHTATLYYRYDGTGSPTHADGQGYDRKDCSACHSHASGFGK